MELLGNRIKLLPFNESDFEPFVEISMCSEMMEHVCDPLTLEEAITAFQAKAQPWTINSTSWLSLGINEISTGEKLGSIGLHIIDHDTKNAEIGYMIKKSAQGKGVGSEALRLLKDYAFNTLNLNKLVATCSINNTGSYKLLEKLGFIREGCLRQNAKISDRYIDDYVYGLCKSDI